MASKTLNFSITDEGYARTWLNELQQLQGEASDLINEVGKALDDVKEYCDADIIDDISKYGREIMTSSAQVIKSMSEIATGVDSFLKNADKVVESAKQIFKGAVKSIATKLN